MTNRVMVRIIVAVCLIAASLFFVAGAFAITENECINGGGSISEGVGCQFCVGGKYDLSEITGKAAKDATSPSTDQKTDKKPAVKSGTGSDTKTPSDTNK
jgi:hypothetical protein